MRDPPRLCGEGRVGAPAQGFPWDEGWAARTTTVRGQVWEVGRPPAGMWKGGGTSPCRRGRRDSRGDKGQSNVQRGPRGGRGQQGQSHNEDAISTGWQSETGQKGAAGALAVSRVGHEAAATEETNAFQVAKG